MSDKLTEQQLWYQNYKAKQKCKYCPESNPDALDFHHIARKNFSISKAVASGYSLKRIKQEIGRCECICSNCHRKHHAKEMREKFLKKHRPGLVKHDERKESTRTDL